MAWLPDGEKFFEDTFIRFDRIYERDRHTHGRTNTVTDTQTHTQTPHNGIGRVYA